MRLRVSIAEKEVIELFYNKYSLTYTTTTITTTFVKNFIS